MPLEHNSNCEEAQYDSIIFCGGFAGETSWRHKTGMRKKHFEILRQLLLLCVFCYTFFYPLVTLIELGLEF